MLAIVREHKLLAAFTTGYIVLLGAWSISVRQSEFVIFGTVVFALVFVVAALDRTVDFSDAVLWALSIWGLAHLAGGVLPSPSNPNQVLYSQMLIPVLLRYDQAVHAFGFGVATLACWQAVRHKLAEPDRISAGTGVLVWFMGMGVGALNEVAEFLSGQLLNKPTTGGYFNTNWDLVANMIGSAAVAVWLTKRHLRGKMEAKPRPSPARAS